MAGALLLLVCNKANIKLKHLINLAKTLDKPLFKKISGIKKSKAYTLLKEMTKTSVDPEMINQNPEFVFDTTNNNTNNNYSAVSVINQH